MARTDQPRLTRRDRRLAAERLTALADEAGQIAAWLDKLGDSDLADRAAQMAECASRDMLACSWVLFRGDQQLPDGWLEVTS
jgi:hypothetical protein